jgi:hypothetical protein
MGKSGITVWSVVACVAFTALGFAAGLIVALPHPAAAPNSALIAEAQKASIYGLEPNWIDIAGNGSVFRAVRKRAYSFCFHDGVINRACAAEQDEAVLNTVSALNIASAQHQMTNKEVLGLKERWVADNPEIVLHVRSYCWNLYKVHGKSDARLLATCFGNLTDFSPLVPLPVP